MNPRTLALCLIAIFAGSAWAAETNVVTVGQFATSDHPRVFARADQRAALARKIEETPWANKLYNDVKERVDPYVERHVDDPEWMVSRLQMNWDEGKHYTDFHTEGNFISRREGDAPFSTVRVMYGRAAPGTVGPPRDLGRLEPYSGSGDLPKEIDGEWVMVPLEETQLGSEVVNNHILDRAYDASIVYYFTGDERYARFAADIVWTFIRGASFHRQVNADEDYNGNGFLSYETLGDSRRFTTVALTYDFIYDYLLNIYFESDEFVKGRPGEKWAPPQPRGKVWAKERVAIYFQKFLDNKISRGGGLEGNWNINEHESAMLYAFAMDDNSAYGNGKGREYYVTPLLYGPTTKGNGAFSGVVEANLNLDTGLWPEAPGGYGQNSIAQLVKFGYWYYQNGIDVLGNDPLLVKGALSFPQIAFPNGRSTGWGDAGISSLEQSVGEYMMAYARAKGDEETEREFATLLQLSGRRRLAARYDGALFFYVPEPVKTAVSISYPRVSYSADHSLVFERNLADSPEDALAYTVYGFGKDSGHRHRNGMAMELYGRGHVLGVDPGAGPDYWHPQHGRYNNQVGAHNTVIPGGRAADRPMDLVIENAEPAIVAGVDPEFQLAPDYQFTDTSIDFNGKADQRRVMGIVRTSPQAGFYVDIFRSRMSNGDETKHDYLYHNMGKAMVLCNKYGKPMRMDRISLDPGSGPGYDNFEGDKGRRTTDDFCAVFNYGISDIRMNAWMLGQEDRTVYALTGPINFRYYLGELRDVRVPTLLVRQEGEACERPFVAVYEPYGDGTKPSVLKVRRLDGAPKTGDFVGLFVESVNGRIDLVLAPSLRNSDRKDSARRRSRDRLVFAGSKEDSDNPHRNGHICHLNLRPRTADNSGRSCSAPRRNRDHWVAEVGNRLLLRCRRCRCSSGRVVG